MENFENIEKIQRAVSTLVQGLQAVSLDLDIYMFFEDQIFNNHYDLAIDAINEDVFHISNEDKIALLFIFQIALEQYNMISSLEPLR